MIPIPDFLIWKNPSYAVLTPVSHEANEWMDENMEDLKAIVSSGEPLTRTVGGGYAVGLREIEGIRANLLTEGFTVERE